MTSHPNYWSRPAPIITYRGHMATSEIEDVPLGDIDIKVIDLSWYSATFSWSSNYSYTSHYEFLCTPADVSAGFNRTIILNPETTNYTLKNLRPSKAYNAWVMTHFSEQGSDILRSSGLQFTTDPVPADIAQSLWLSQLVDIVLVLCLLACWGSACFVFYKQWSSFHLQLPKKYTHYKNSPKGLENIKVIKRAQDSIIYRNHNQAMNNKITERNRKLARMHTSPAALVEAKEDPLDISKNKPAIKRRTTALM